MSLACGFRELKAGIRLALHGMLPGFTIREEKILLSRRRDGTDGFVATERTKAFSLVWYKFNGRGWDKYVVNKIALHIEGGGVFHNIDGDGELDIFGKQYSYGAPDLHIYS